MLFIFCNNLPNKTFTTIQEINYDGTTLNAMSHTYFLISEKIEKLGKNYTWNDIEDIISLQQITRYVANYNFTQDEIIKIFQIVQHVFRAIKVYFDHGYKIKRITSQITDPKKQKNSKKSDVLVSLFFEDWNNNSIEIKFSDEISLIIDWSKS